MAAADATLDRILRRAGRLERDCLAELQYTGYRARLGQFQSVRHIGFNGALSRTPDPIASAPRGSNFQLKMSALPSADVAIATFFSTQFITACVKISLDGGRICRIL